MKKLFISALAAISIIASAQEYQPREGWPYLFEDFSAGIVTNHGGEVSAEGFFNVCVVDGKLHYVQDGKIMEANMNHLQAVRIGDRVFINRMGRLKEVVAEERGGSFVLREVNVDLGRPKPC